MKFYLAASVCLANSDGPTLAGPFGSITPEQSSFRFAKPEHKDLFFYFIFIPMVQANDFGFGSETGIWEAPVILRGN